MAAAATLCAPPSFATVLQLTTSKDNTLFEDPTGSLSYGAGDGMFVGRVGAGGIRRAIFAFDLPALPSNAVVNPATTSVHLTVTKTLTADMTVELHKATQNWGEGDSNTSGGGGGGGAGGPAHTGDVTWTNTFYPSQFWANPGGDFSPTVSASANTAALDFSGAQLVADIQGWINNSATNFGWIAIGNEVSSSAKRIATKEYFDAASRPRLTIDYNTSTWKTSAGGNWSLPGNWDFNVPDGVGAEANFPAAGSNVTVTVDSSKVVSTINFTGATSYTLAGPGFLTLSRNAPGNNRINVAAGNATIAAPLNLDNNTTFTVAPSSVLTITGNIAATPNVDISVSVNGGGKAVVNNLRTAGLSITGGTLAIAPDGGLNGTSRLGSIAIGAGKFDLSNNKLIVNGGDIAALTAYIASGRNGGSWDGNGIITSQTTAAAGNSTTIGIATAQQARNLPNPTDTVLFSGQTVTGTDALVMYTYGGDANLDGKITISDYGKIDFNVAIPGASGWANGDFNYDGKITISDYGIIDFNIGIQGPPFPTGTGISAVPEPTSTVLMIAACGVANHRRRPRRQHMHAQR